MTNTPPAPASTLPWAAVRSALPWLAAGSALAGAATYAILSLMPSSHRAEAVIAITGAIEPHLSALRSPELVSRVAGRVLLAGGKDGKAIPEGGAGGAEAAVQGFLSRLEVARGSAERQIAIRFSASDPKVAATGADALAEAYRDLLAERRAQRQAEIDKEGGSNLARLEDELKSAEVELARLSQAAAEAASAPDKARSAIAPTDPLATELARAKAAREEADSKHAKARELLRSGRAESLAEAQGTPILKTLIEQRVRLERQIKELSATLLPAHPRMRQLNADLKGLKQQIEGEVTLVIETLAKEAKAAGEREDKARKALEAASARIAESGRDGALVKQLEASIAGKRSEVERLSNEIAAARKLAASRAAPAPEARIVTKAATAVTPASPRKGPYSALIAGAVLLLGLAFAITRAVLGGARREADRLGAAKRSEAMRNGAGDGARKEPSLPITGDAAARAGAMPPQTVAAPAQSPITAAAQSDPVVGSVEELARLLIGQARDGTGVRTLVTGGALSAVVADQALGLAEALSQSGAEVLVVDWSADGEGLAKSLGWGDRVGLAELIEGSASFDRAIRPVPGSRVHALVAGNDLPAYPGAIDLDRLNLVLDALDEVYDQIIVTGRHGEARMLFEAIEGRFDAGVIVGPVRREEATGAAGRTFLGFDVEGLLVVHLEMASAKANPITRIARNRVPERISA